MPIPKKNPKVIELFAGVGGFRLGLEQAGWQVCWSNQWEPATKTQHASSCYVANFGPENHINEDIKISIDKYVSGVLDIPDAELLVGGFPCQDYSVAKSKGSSKGLEGKKGVLWWEIHRLVELKRPKFIFLENVDRLLKSPATQRGRDFAIMLRTLGDLGYLIEWQVVNAADYGNPQRRIRVFIVAKRLDSFPGQTGLLEESLKDGVLARSLPRKLVSGLQSGTLNASVFTLSSEFNAGASSSPFQTVGCYLDGAYLTSKHKATFRGNFKTLRDVLMRDVDVPSDYWIEPTRLKEWEFLKGAKSLKRVSKSGHEYNYTEGKMSFPDSLDRASRTILTGEGGSSPSRFKHVVQTEGGFRRLLPVELERLNGFPDDWTKLDSSGNQISDIKRAFFMGNALVIPLISRVGKTIREDLFG